VKMRKLFFCFVFLILSAGIISAIATEITIKTIPEHQVQVTAYEPSSTSFTPLDSLIETSDEYGDVSKVFSIDKSPFNLLVYVKKDGVTIISEKYIDGFTAGVPVYLELAPKWFTLIYKETNITNLSTAVENETVEETAIPENLTSSENLNDTNPEKGSIVTGFASFNYGEVFSKKSIYYIFGIVVLVVLIIFLRGRMGAGVSMQLTKPTSKHKDEISLDDEDFEDSKKRKHESEELREAEKKLKEAEEEVKNVKIKEIKDKLIEEEKELMKLRKGK